MATTALTNSFRRDILNGVVDLSTDAVRMALYSGSTHGFNTTAYTTTAESSGTGYTAAGELMAGATQTTDTTTNASFYDWNDVTWTTSTITATDCLVYLPDITTPTADLGVYVGDFNGSKSSSSGTFTVTLPVAAYNTALVRIA